jgi:hypothetical protein
MLRLARTPVRVAGAPRSPMCCRRLHRPQKARRNPNSTSCRPRTRVAPHCVGSRTTPPVLRRRSPRRGLRNAERFNRPVNVARVEVKHVKGVKVVGTTHVNPARPAKGVASRVKARRAVPASHARSNLGSHVVMTANSSLAPIKTTRLRRLAPSRKRKPVDSSAG